MIFFAKKAQLDIYHKNYSFYSVNAGVNSGRFIRTYKNINNKPHLTALNCIGIILPRESMQVSKVKTKSSDLIFSQNFAI